MRHLESIIRKGLSLIQVTDMINVDATAQAWFEDIYWPEGPICPYCGTGNVQSGIKHKTMTHRCRECEGRPMFSLKTGTAMGGPNSAIAWGPLPSTC